MEDVFCRLDGTRFHLIAIGQGTTPPKLKERLAVHEVVEGPENDRELARLHIPKPSYFLVRPDGHIGLAGLRVEGDALKRYLAERHIRLPGAPAEPTVSSVRAG